MKNMGVKQVIKSLDAFPRAEEHLLKKTQSGALGKNQFNYVFLFVFLGFSALYLFIFYLFLFFFFFQLRFS